MTSKVDSAIDTIMHEVSELDKAKNGAYSERNKLVALLASIYPSWLTQHPIEDESWDLDWCWIVFVKLPTGQASWHIHNSELSMFAHLDVRDANNPHIGERWDGHSTEQKYLRLETAAEAAFAARLTVRQGGIS